MLSYEAAVDDRSTGGTRRERRRSAIDAASDDPPRKRAISSSGRCVAERPMRCGGARTRRSSRSSVSARCAPRFVPAIAWISSTITARTRAEHPAPAHARQHDVQRLRRRDQDVRRLAQHPRARRRRRVARAHGDADLGKLLAAASKRSRSSASGRSRLRWTSLLSALSGET